VKGLSMNLCIAIFVAGACWLSGSASATRAAASCASVADPYSLPVASLEACGMPVYPRTSVTSLPGGGTQYNYAVNGTAVFFRAPPPGFEPLTATQAQLNEYGLPARPTDPSASARWSAMMQNLHFVPPPPYLVANPLAHFTDYNSHWSGQAATSNSPSAYSSVDATWTEPGTDSNSCSNSPMLGVWVGLGGGVVQDQSSYISQDGTAVNVPGFGNHQSWVEDTVLGNPVAANVYAHPGYGFTAETIWQAGAMEYHWYLYDGYSGDYQDLYNATSYYNGSSAEAIVERPSVDSPLEDLLQFSQVNFTPAANGNAFTGYSTTPIYMTSSGYSNGTPLANPSGIGSNDQFTVTWKNCS